MLFGKIFVQSYKTAGECGNISDIYAQHGLQSIFEYGIII